MDLIDDVTWKNVFICVIYTFKRLHDIPKRDY
jgi:hypothetical protein